MARGLDAGLGSEELGRTRLQVVDEERNEVSLFGSRGEVYAVLEEDGSESVSYAQWMPHLSCGTCIVDKNGGKPNKWQRCDERLVRWGRGATYSESGGLEALCEVYFSRWRRHVVWKWPAGGCLAVVVVEEKQRKRE